MPKLEISPNLKKLVKSEGSLFSNAATLREALEEFFVQNPELQERILTRSGTLQKYVKVFIDGEDANFLQGLNSQLRPQSKIKIFTALAGG